MKLPYEDRVLRPDALHPLRLSSGIVGFTLDVRLNYYRGLPLSAVENLELSVDGVRVPDHLVLAGLREKIFPLARYGWRSPNTGRSKASCDSTSTTADLNQVRTR
jgi:hypothetical protein